ncbi:Fas apoptotic inhibitory molecule 2 [Trachymyrmex zeteki]|uniref:Fas apoptotic inhibitory molecule 2 n=1 Tax=Mycetomoellerius zeteki TaxID=64791 RepID=A0A151XI59_9HYME|nr:Fas apoptotic inhibitory molecule 2 [Trachymyrmex zeteki]
MPIRAHNGGSVMIKILYHICLYLFRYTGKNERSKRLIYVNERFHSAYPMQSDDIDIEEQRIPQNIPGPPQLPPLIKGQKLKSGPYTVTVTDEMVAQRERENLELYKAWVRDQRRRNMLPQEEADEFIGDFKDIIIRRSFVRKVFCLLTMQLIFTIFVISIFLFWDEAQKFMIVYWYLWIVAMVVFIVAYCTVSCSVHARRTAPFNYICLILLTMGMSYLAAFVSVFYTIEVILIVLGMTAIVTMIIALVATFSTYLYFDVQTIMGGRRIELSPEEVIFATTQIYVDIVLLYQYLLMFMGFFHR